MTLSDADIIRALTAHIWALLRRAESIQTNPPSLDAMEASAASSVREAEGSLRLVRNPDGDTGGGGDDEARILYAASRVRYLGDQLSLTGPEGINWFVANVENLFSEQDDLGGRLAYEVSSTPDLAIRDLDPRRSGDPVSYQRGWTVSRK